MKTELGKANKYSLQFGVKITVLDLLRRVLEGTTVEVSSKEVLLEVKGDLQLSDGMPLELAIAWPRESILRGPIQLVTKGKAIRTVGSNQLVVDIQKWAFEPIA